MTDEILDELRRRQVYQQGHFRLSSGLHSDTYLQCALALEDPRFAAVVGRRLAAAVGGGRFSLVASPAVGGLLAGFVVAQAAGTRFVFTERVDGGMRLRRGQAVAPGERILLVEDVLTTGGSAAEAAAVLEAEGGVVVAYAAIVDRSSAERPLPFDATALVRLEPLTWPPDSCPLCDEGVAVDSPGSRHR